MFPFLADGSSEIKALKQKNKNVTAVHFQFFLLRVNFALTLSFLVLATHQTLSFDQLGMYQV